MSRWGDGMKRWLVALWALGLLAGPVFAASEKGRFDVYVQGQKAGELRFQGREKATSYTAQISLKLRGSDTRFEGKVAGALELDTYIPAKYSEKSQIGGRSAHVSMAFVEGTAQPKHKGALMAHWVTPDAAVNLPDPVTALWQLFQARLPATLCQLETGIYDGARRMSLRTLSPKPRGDAVTCLGNLFRDAGYSEDELSNGTAFAFEIEYAPSRDGTYRANRIDLNTARGRVILVRR